MVDYNRSGHVKDTLVILETERLILRRQKESDVDALVTLWSNPQVTRYLGGPRDQQALRESFVQSALSPFSDDYDLWPVVEKKTGRVIGHSGLLDKEVEGKTEIELVYVISPERWGKGYATEIALALTSYAFESLRVDRVVALVEPENKPSERVAVKIGMTYKSTITRPNGNVRKLYFLDSPDAS